MMDRLTCMVGTKKRSVDMNIKSGWIRCYLTASNESLPVHQYIFLTAEMMIRGTTYKVKDLFLR